MKIVHVKDTEGDELELAAVGDRLHVGIIGDVTHFHFDRPGAAQLARILQHFADTGSLPEEQSNGN